MNTTFKKVLSLVMILMMVVSTMVILPLTASATEVTAVAPTGAGTEEDPWKISEPGNLVWMGKRDPLSGGWYALTNDIDMAGVTNFVSWKTSANVTVNFEGNGYAIKNLTVNDGMDGAWVGGLFGMSCGNDTIKNLKLEGLKVNNTTGNTMIAGLVGQANEGSTLTIENVTIDNQSVITAGSPGSDTFTGGFIGQVTGAKTITIKDCANYALVDGNISSTTGSRTGGFIGKIGAAATVKFENCVMGNNVKGVHAGGYIGSVEAAVTADFKNCSYSGQMVGNQAGTVGGFIAYVESTSATLVAENCVVEAPTDAFYCANTSTKMGGFFGWLNGCGSVTMTDCVNKASLNNAGSAAGFIARANKPNITMTRCFNTGNVKASGAWEAGGFIGVMQNTDDSAVKTVKMEYCVNAGAVTTQATVGGLIGSATSANIKFDFDYCANTGALTTTRTAAASEVGCGAMGGLIGIVANGVQNTSITADNCYNIGSMTMPTPVASYGGVGGLVGCMSYSAGGHTVAFNNCFVDVTAESANTVGDFYGVARNAGNQTITTANTCKTGEAAEAGIATINGEICGADLVRTSKKLSIRMKLTDDFGFMAIADLSVFAAGVAEEYGFYFAQEEFENAQDAKKVEGSVYNRANRIMQAAYTELTAATLDNTVYFTPYAVVNGVTYLGTIREINCLTVAEDLQDGKIGNATVTTSEEEMALYTAMVKYHKAYKEYLYGGVEEDTPKEPLSPSELLTGLPAFHATPTKTLATGNNSKVAIFADSTVTNFNNYCAALEAAGYEEYSKTEFHGGSMSNAGQESYYKGYFNKDFDSNFAANNYFATYVSDDRTIDLAFHEYDNFMYMSVSPLGELTLPNNEAPTVSNPRPITITQVGTGDLHDEADMCYVIQLADGSFIVYDTGLSYASRGYVADEIYKVLQKQATDKNNIVISAFVLTHPHLDHIEGFLQFSNRYAGNTAIKVKQVVYNFPGVECMSPEIRPSEHQNRLDVETAIKRFGSGVEIVKPRSGNVLHYAGVKFNVLYTQEDYLSLADDFAGSSMGNVMTLVMQMETADGTKTLFGGDHWADQCQGQLKYRYGTFLQSYIVTLFHHGLGGGAENTTDATQSIYATTIKPKIVLWPISWYKMSATGSTYTRYFSDSKWNQYFTKGKTAGTSGEPGTGGFEEGKIHSTPNANGVYGWFVADDGIQILTFNSQNNVSVATYGTRQAYYDSNN